MVLSNSQREVFDGWKRPEELFYQLRARFQAGNAELRLSMNSNSTVDLVQDITTDCSVIASLCAGTARAERGHGKVGLWYDLNNYSTLLSVTVPDHIVYNVSI